MPFIKPVPALLLAALLLIVTAVAHLSCIVLGPACYQAQLAPSEVVQSALEGTMLAPLATVLVSGLFLLCALYAVSSAGLIRHLPLLRPAMFCLALLFVVRGIATLPLSLMYPEMVSAFSVVAGILWLLCGLCFWSGYRHLLR